MNKKIIKRLIIIATIIAFAINKLIFDQRGQSGSLPNYTLLQQKKYVEDHLRKYNYDYKVNIGLDGDHYGIMWVDMYKGDCDVVERLFSMPKDKIMEITATPHPEMCFYVKK